MVARALPMIISLWHNTFDFSFVTVGLIIEEKISLLHPSGAS